VMLCLWCQCTYVRMYVLTYVRTYACKYVHHTHTYSSGRGNMKDSGNRTYNSSKIFCSDLTPSLVDELAIVFIYMCFYHMVHSSIVSQLWLNLLVSFTMESQKSWLLAFKIASSWHKTLVYNFMLTMRNIRQD
jgi:hypothetical protein